MRRRNGVGALVVVAAALVAAGCGIPDDDGPHVLRNAVLPAERVPAEAAPDDAAPTTMVFLVVGDRLVPVGRPEQAGLAEAIRLLIAGPRDTEAAFGLRSAVPTGTELLAAEASSGTARIDLSEAFTRVVGPEQILATAQLVFTATAIAGVERVEIAIAGQPVDLPRGDGTLATGAVARVDYAGLVSA